MNRAARSPAYQRCAVVVLGVYLAGVGLNALTRGDMLYLNWLRSPVAAPVALVIGVILVVVGFKLPD